MDLHTEKVFVSRDVLFMRMYFHLLLILFTQLLVHISFILYHFPTYSLLNSPISDNIQLPTPQIPTPNDIHKLDF